MTKRRSALRTTQIRYCCWNFVSTPIPKSDGKPTRKTVLGSKRVRGRKNLKNIRKSTARKPPTRVQIMPRRVLFTGSTGLVSTVLVLAPAEDPTTEGLAAFTGFSTGVVVAALGFSSVTDFWSVS